MEELELERERRATEEVRYLWTQALLGLCGFAMFILAILVMVTYIYIIFS